MKRLLSKKILAVTVSLMMLPSSQVMAAGGASSTVATGSPVTVDGTLSMPTLGQSVSSIGSSTTGNDNSTSATTTPNSTTNQTGQQVVNANTVGNIAPTGSGTQAGATSIGAPTANNVELDANGCPIPAALDQAKLEAVQLAQVTPNIDAIFNAADKASEGCFASSREMINLAINIPSINGNLTDIVKQALMKEIEKQKALILKRVCNIADNALLSVLQPLQNYTTIINSKIEEASLIFGDLGVPVTYKSSKVIDNLFTMQKEALESGIANHSAAVARQIAGIEAAFGGENTTPVTSTDAFGGTFSIPKNTTNSTGVQDVPETPDVPVNTGTATTNGTPVPNAGAPTTTPTVTSPTPTTQTGTTTTTGTAPSGSSSNIFSQKY